MWWTWLASMLWIVAPLFWWCCCVKCGSGCLSCNPRYSNDIQVVIAGIATNSVPSAFDCRPGPCEVFDGTFILSSTCCVRRICRQIDLAEIVEPDCCEWEYDVGMAGCDVTLGFTSTAIIRFRVVFDGTNYKSEIIASSYQPGGAPPIPPQSVGMTCFTLATYRLVHGTSKPNCAAFSSTAHTLIGSPSLVCDTASSTAEATSL